ncbi:MAG TPA: bifunctional glycosyltransferase family 2/GtrA family protein [Acidothermaceae bacterium]
MTTTMQLPDELTEEQATSAPAIEIVIPVHNEEHDLEPSVRRLHEYLTSTFPLSFRITIADNASTDDTWPIACALEAELANVRATYLSKKGRGLALHAVWLASAAEVVCYMDVDLSTDLSALLPLVAPLLSGHSDVAIGTRLARSSRVVRGPKREVISRCYNVLLRTTLATQFSDAQCGFKAMRTDRARELLPMVQDNGWFFDTELLVLAERSGMRIHEVPVDWIDDPDSRVDIVQTAIADGLGIARLARDLARGRIPLRAHRDEVSTGPLGAQLFRFCSVGIASTLAYIALFLVARTTMSAAWSNAIALLITAIGNTAVNRSFTFGVRGRTARLQHQLQGLAVFGIGLALSMGALAALHAAAPHAGRSIEVATLVVANLAATILRFLLFRSWVFRRPSDALNSHPSRTSTTTVREFS